MDNQEAAGTILRTAVVTGACSGMGLALTRHLLATRRWRVVLVDIDPTKYDSIAGDLEKDTHLFVACDVSQWEQQLKVFETAFKWNDGRRIDFLAMNAGVDDLSMGPRWPFAKNDTPSPPSLKILAIDLHAIIYGTHLFVHFARETRKKLSTTSAVDDFHPMTVVTASMASQYPFDNMPQYTAAKHGCLGWVRAAAPSLWERDRVSIHCILPGTVDTGLIPQSIMSKWPAQYLTPVSTILRAFDRLMSAEGEGKRTGVEQRLGLAIEATGDELFERTHVDFANESQRWITAQSKADGIIGKATTAFYGMSD